MVGAGSYVRYVLTVAGNDSVGVNSSVGEIDVKVRPTPAMGFDVPVGEGDDSCGFSVKCAGRSEERAIESGRDFERDKANGPRVAIDKEESLRGGVNLRNVFVEV